MSTYLVIRDGKQPNLFLKELILSWALIGRSLFYPLTFKICGRFDQEMIWTEQIKKARKLGKLDYRLRKAQIDLDFLINCSNNFVIPTFLNLCLAIKCLKSLRTYRQCQLNLLHEEINQQISDIRVLLKELGFLHSTLQTEISLIGIVHVLSQFLGHNDKVLKQKSTIQRKKLNNLLKDKEPQHNTEKIILFYSRYILSEVEKSLLQNGLNFTISPKKLNHADYLVSFELFHRDIRNLQVLSAEDLGFIKTKTKDIALSSFRK